LELAKDASLTAMFTVEGAKIYYLPQVAKTDAVEVRFDEAKDDDRRVLRSAKAEA
jgi:hypothetical protein